MRSEKDSDSGMGTGVSVNPVTLRPKQLKDKEEERQKAVVEEKKLREQAEDLNIIQSEGGKRFIEMILDKMQRRIEHLIVNDEEAKAYLHLLTELGHKYNAAKRATTELYKRQFSG